MAGKQSTSSDSLPAMFVCRSCVCLFRPEAAVGCGSDCGSPVVAAPGVDCTLPVQEEKGS